MKTTHEVGGEKLGGNKHGINPARKKYGGKTGASRT